MSGGPVRRGACESLVLSRREARPSIYRVTSFAQLLYEQDLVHAHTRGTNISNTAVQLNVNNTRSIRHLNGFFDDDGQKTMFV